MKKILSLTLCLAMLTAFCVAAAAASGDASPDPTDESVIIDRVVENFSLLTQIPRPSHHEEQISAFFMDWAREQGLDPVQDDVYNVMFGVPATEGLEEYPLGILQVHMDMVVAVADGKDFDPLTDPITVIRNDADNTLTADGTSLGSDDGIGCAIVMTLVQGGMEHGPLRVIITVDEEDGMEGAFHLDASWLKDASYLINVDNEWSTDVLVSTAAGDSVRVFHDLRLQDAAGDLALDIELSGLTGGHSGVEIDKGRLNGIIGLADFLKRLGDNGVGFALASFSGGTAGNAIPTGARCTIVVSAKDTDAVKALAESYASGLREAYAGVEDGLSFTVAEADTVPQVVSEEEKTNAIRFLTEVIDGVYTWSADMEGLVESSSNLGLFSLDGSGLNAATYTRSSAADKETEILDAQLALAAECGYESESVKMADAWPYAPDSLLLALTKEAFLEQHGVEITVSAVHAGLECGTFHLLNPALDMISIGPDISDAHTVRETLYLDSIPTVWNLLAALLLRVGQ